MPNTGCCAWYANACRTFLAGLLPPVNPNKIMQHLPSRWMLNPVTPVDQAQMPYLLASGPAHIRQVIVRLLG